MLADVADCYSSGVLFLNEYSARAIHYLAYTGVVVYSVNFVFRGWRLSGGGLYSGHCQLELLGAVQRAEPEDKGGQRGGEQ